MQGFSNLPYIWKKCNVQFTWENLYPTYTRYFDGGIGCVGRCEVDSSKDNSIRRDLTVQMELYVEVSRCTDGFICTQKVQSFICTAESCPIKSPLGVSASHLHPHPVPPRKSHTSASLCLMQGVSNLPYIWKKTKIQFTYENLYPTYAWYFDGGIGCVGRCEVHSSKANSIRRDLTVQMELYVEVPRCTDGSICTQKLQSFICTVESGPIWSSFGESVSHLHPHLIPPTKSYTAASSCIMQGFSNLPYFWKKCKVQFIYENLYLTYARYFDGGLGCVGRCEVPSSKKNSIGQDLTVQMELYVEVSRCTDGSMCTPKVQSFICTVESCPIKSPFGESASHLHPVKFNSL